MAASGRTCRRWSRQTCSRLPGGSDPNCRVDNRSCRGISHSFAVPLLCSSTVGTSPTVRLLPELPRPVFPMALSSLVETRPGAVPVIMTQLSHCRARYSRLNSQNCAAFSCMIFGEVLMIITLHWADNAVHIES